MDYQNGKIYTIRSPHTEKYYIGSCKIPLSKRWWTHKNRLNCTSREIIALGDAYIEIMELYPCNNKMELRKREGELQRLHKADIVNFRTEGRTEEEKRENQHIYCKKRYEEHKERLLLAQKIYRTTAEAKNVHNERKKIYTKTPEFRAKRNAKLKEKRRLKNEANLVVTEKK